MRTALFVFVLVFTGNCFAEIPDNLGLYWRMYDSVKSEFLENRREELAGFKARLLEAQSGRVSATARAGRGGVIFRTHQQKAKAVAEWKSKVEEAEQVVGELSGATAMTIPSISTVTRIGDIGTSEGDVIVQVTSDSEMLLETSAPQPTKPNIKLAIEMALLESRKQPAQLFWVRGINTKGFTDGMSAGSDNPLIAVDTKRYATNAGMRTVFVLEKTTKEAVEKHWLEHRKGMKAAPKSTPKR